MGQARNRGTREERVAQAILKKRAERMFRGTETGRFSGTETHFKEVDKVPRVEVVPAPPVEMDLAKIEERVLASGVLVDPSNPYGELKLHDHQREILKALAENPNRTIVLSPPRRAMSSMTLAGTAFGRRGILGLAALAAGALAELNRPPTLVVIDDVSDNDMSPERRKAIKDAFLKEFPNGGKD